MNSALSHTHVITRLQDARERVAHGWPSIAVALAGNPISTAQARLAEAAVAAQSRPLAKPWALVLADALAAADDARALWGSASDAIPPMTADLAPCGKELRMHLPDARHCAELGLAWEDPGGLSRGQALCVLHLAVRISQWRALEQRADAAAEKARAELARERSQSAALAARTIWGGASGRPPAPAIAKDSRSLRELAREMGVLRQADEKEED